MTESSGLLVGMLHLPALPGSPRSEQSLDAIEEHVLEDARRLREAGFEIAILENFGDVPFRKDRVDAITIAAMTCVSCRLRRDVPELRLGVNVLRNDARAALAVAAASGAQFMRVNVHVGATATDQGIVEGQAHETLRARRSLGAEVAVWADVHVKHGHNLSHVSIVDEAKDAVERGLADALIVSGSGTGETTALEDVEAVAGAGLGVPVLVGSGVLEQNVRSYLAVADGVIVGTSLKVDGKTTNPIDEGRARRLVESARSK